MISDTDVNDWIMLTEPLKLKDLKEGEFFSFHENDFFNFHEDGKIFKIMDKTKAEDVTFASPTDLFCTFTLPDFYGVFKWVTKQNEKAKSTNN